MTKEEAYHAFVASFGWATYDENTVPDEAPMPRNTYNFTDSEFGSPVAMSISAWNRSTSWATVTDMKNRIYNAIGLGGKVIPFDSGYLWIKRGRPFSQRMADEDDSIRRIYINVEVEYLTAK